MAIVCNVSTPVNAVHLELVMEEFHKTYSYDRILFETVVPIPGNNDLYRFITVYNDNDPEPTSISEEVVINDDTKGE